MINFFKKNIFSLAVLALLFIGFAFRLYGLPQNYSFWTDEASTARFALGVVKTGIPKSLATGYVTDAYYTTDYLTGLSFLIFGPNEMAARLPEVIFGTILIAVVYLFGKKLFNREIGLGGALFTTFSFIQIAWSRQARGYTIFEVFFVLSLFWLYKLFEDRKVFSAIILFFFVLLAILTHTLGLVLIPIVFVFWLIQGNIKKIFSDRRTYLAIIFISVIFFILPVSRKIIEFLFSYKISNVLQGKTFISYYHSLFWRQYPLFSFLGFLGFLYLFLKKEKAQAWLLLVSILLYLTMTSFLLHVPFEKYGLAIFPLLFTIASFALFRISEALFPGKKFNHLIYFVLVLFIILNGNKFSFKPKKFYSLNFDMREIPEIDYKKIYALVKEKSAKVNPKNVAVIDIDEDIPAWYLGENGNYFNPRNDVPGEEKSRSVGAVYLRNLDEIIKIYKKFPYGFVFLIEHNFRFYPEGMVDWVRKNLVLEKKESFASFSPDWNYWPVELYSWGFENVKKR